MTAEVEAGRTAFKVATTEHGTITVTVTVSPDVIGQSPGPSLPPASVGR
jgi:hypothetical protein